MLCSIFERQLQLMAHQLAAMQVNSATERSAGTEGAGPGPSVRRADLRESRLPLNDGQRELWTLSQLSPVASCALNESFVLQIDGQLDVARLVSAAQTVVARHDAFRIRFNDDGLEQRLIADAGFSVRVCLADSVDDVVRREARLPFCLDSGPTIRAVLVQDDIGRHSLVVYAHHLVMDGWSAGTLVRELCEEYDLQATGADPLEQVPVPSYVEYLLSGEQQLDQQVADRRWRYWLSQHEGRRSAAIDLPWDRDRAPVASFEGQTVRRQFSAEVTEWLRGWAREHGVTPYAVLLALSARVLGEIANQEEVVILLPAAGQAAHGVDVVGYCVQVLPVRLERGTGQSLVHLARTATTKVRSGFSHAGISISELAARCGWPRDRGRVSTIDVMFNYSAYAPVARMGECSVIVKENPRSAVIYDLFFNFTEGVGGLEVQLSYRESLAERSTIDGWLTYLFGMLDACMERAADPPADMRGLASREEGDAEGLKKRTKGA
jgi:hypothetical protein